MLFSSSINTQILCLSSDPASLQKKISHTDLLFLISSIFSLLPAILYALTHCGESSPSVTVQIQARDKTSLWCETTERSTLITLALSIFVHPFPRHPFLLGTENESVSADYRSSFSRFSTSLLREKKKVFNRFLSLSTFA